MQAPPSKVKIGLHDYKIEVWPPHEASSAHRYGECNHVLHIIRVDTSHTLVQSGETLLHEIIHAVYAVWNIEDDDKEERTVGGLSLGLATVWRDNPDVFAWIAMNLTAQKDVA